MKKEKNKFDKFDKAENDIKAAQDDVVELAKEIDKPEDKELLLKAARDLEKAEAEVEEVDEKGF